jgi:hypothetical protein
VVAEGNVSQSRLQEPFMTEFVATFVATKTRIIRRLTEAPITAAADIVEDELRGLCHGLLVIFDGGTALADKGLVQLVDEDGEPFDRFLHEKCSDYWPMGDNRT